ncbi:hypothetical protein GCM10010421_03020 [Streptomyces glaucus]|uniref:Secreted protein n=1 Tax=Streptomyces glaucus TaxID=284029 RepID=A0ABN3J4H3_9ACTN
MAASGLRTPPGLPVRDSERPGGAVLMAVAYMGTATRDRVKVKGAAAGPGARALRRACRPPVRPGQRSAQRYGLGACRPLSPRPAAPRPYGAARRLAQEDRSSTELPLTLAE